MSVLILLHCLKQILNQCFIHCFRLSFHVVGNPLCLVMLWPFCMRRDKWCPLYRVRNFCDTNHFQSSHKLSGSMEGSFLMVAIFFLSQKYWDLVEIFQKKRKMLGTWYKFCVGLHFTYDWLHYYCIGLMIDYIIIV